MDASIVIPSIVRDSLYPLLEDLLRQRFTGEFEIVVIAQPVGRIDHAQVPADSRIVVNEQPAGLGFGYYRAVGAEIACGRIIAWIDDDERPIGNDWLQRITQPIAEGRASAVTAGYHIPLGHGYLADSISWLGLPGGGYPGFETMWKVGTDGCTDHLCAGNFAIDSKVLAQVGGFAKSMAYGNEDTELSARLRSAGVRILYESSATVLHEPRKDLRTFLTWHVARGAAHRAMIATPHERSRQLIAHRLKTSAATLWRTLPTRYFPGVVFAMSLQYLAQAIGYFGVVQSSKHHGRQPESNTK